MTDIQQYLTLALTVDVTISTIVYTFYSVRLWHTSRQAAEISRQAALANLWTELNRLVDISKREGRPEAKFLEDLSGIFAEYMITRLVSDASAENDRHWRAFQDKIEDLMLASDMDSDKIKWLTPFTKKGR